MGSPPVVAPASQLNVIEVAERCETVSVKLTGASGIVRMRAPLPSGDSSEGPYKL